MPTAGGPLRWSIARLIFGVTAATVSAWALYENTSTLAFGVRVYASILLAWGVFMSVGLLLFFCDVLLEKQSFSPELRLPTDSWHHWFGIRGYRHAPPRSDGEVD